MLFLPPTPTQTFDRLERAHAAWTRGGATVDVTNVTATGSRHFQYRLDLDGKGGASLRVKAPAQGKVAPTDEGFLLRGGAIFGVDYVAREAIRRAAPDAGPVAVRFATVIGGVDDTIGFLTSKAHRDQYLLPLRTLKGWRATPDGLLRATTVAGKTSLSRISLDPSGRLRALHIELPGSRLDWRFAYGPYRAMEIPRGLRLVDAFTQRLQPPKYANAAARTVAERLLSRAARLTSAIVRLDGSATLWLSGSRVRYEAGGSGFAYDGRRLTVVTPGAAYQGRTSRRAVIDNVAALLGNVDPFVRAVLVRAALFRELFPPESTVRVVGTMAQNGVSCDVLSVAGARVRASIFARKSDGLPLSVETTTLDARGDDLSTTRREFAWVSVDAPVPDGLFALHLRKGQRVLPLPKTAIER